MTYSLNTLNTPRGDAASPRAGVARFAHEIALGLGLVALVYGLQVFVVSPLWMARFRYGPMEWLWRSVTYWRLEPLARA